MTTINGLPAHVLLVHAIVVLLPLSALLLAVTGIWATARRRLAGPNALLAVLVVILVPITTDAGEWLERRVARTPLLRTHTELGDTALYVAIPVAVLALVVWWRQRESATIARRSEVEPEGTGGTTTMTKTAAGRRTFLAPASKTVTTVIAVLAVVAAGAACYDVYRIGDSGAQAGWQGQFSSDPAPGGGH